MHCNGFDVYTKQTVINYERIVDGRAFIEIHDDNNVFYLFFDQETCKKSPSYFPFDNKKEKNATVLMANSALYVASVVYIGRYRNLSKSTLRRNILVFV